MVVVGFDLRAVEFGGINRQRIAFLDDLRAALGQLGAQGDDALAFLDAQAAEVGEPHRLRLQNGASTIAVMMLSPRSVCRGKFGRLAACMNNGGNVRIHLPIRVLGQSRTTSNCRRSASTSLADLFGCNLERSPEIASSTKPAAQK